MSYMNNVRINFLDIVSKHFINMRIEVLVIECGILGLVIIDVPHMNTIANSVVEFIQRLLLILKPAKDKHLIILSKLASEIICIDFTSSHIIWRVTVNYLEDSHKLASEIMMAKR